jgi:hypothetical protein
MVSDSTLLKSLTNILVSESICKKSSLVTFVTIPGLQECCDIVLAMVTVPEGSPEISGLINNIVDDLNRALPIVSLSVRILKLTTGKRVGQRLGGRLMD